MKQLLWYLVAGTRGGETRARIIDCVKKRPANAHQIAVKLGLDYKTVQHHLRVLVENDVLAVVNKGKYGAAYYLSEELVGIWEEIGKK